MYLLGEKTKHEEFCSPSIFSFTDSSATHKGDKDFGGSIMMITLGLDVYLYSKVNSIIGMVCQTIKNTLIGERANLPLLLDLSWNMFLPSSHHGWDGIY